MEENQSITQDFYSDIHTWRSMISFIDHEIRFIQKLLNSYIFEPTTPNLFERLELFKEKFVDSQRRVVQMKKIIAERELEIGGMLESGMTSFDLDLGVKHKEAVRQLEAFNLWYLELKSEVYEYASSVLKQKKNISRLKIIL